MSAPGCTDSIARIAWGAEHAAAPLGGSLAPGPYRQAGAGAWTLARSQSDNADARSDLAETLRGAGLRVSSERIQLTG